MKKLLMAVLFFSGMALAQISNPSNVPIVLTVNGADVTCGTSGTLTPCTSATTITGLSKTLPVTSTNNWAYECDLIYSQATANAANGVGVQTATNAATNLTYSLVAYTGVTANGTASTVGVSSTTAQTTAFTPTATVGTKMTLRLFGTIEGASASGTTFNAVILTGNAADLLTIYRGSKCVLFPQ